MADILSTPNSYKSLSIKDLLLARDLYHYHLLNKPNVVGTAVGLYLIRDDDPEPAQQARRRGHKPKPERRNKGERNLWNSSTREYSCPCVHAFVREWKKESDFGGGRGELHPEDLVPRTLGLPDGRMVPVCVTRVTPAEAPAPGPQWVWPGGQFGGGMPLVVHTQGRDRQATAGCLVTDGHTTYALTSRHVCGDGGEPIEAVARGKRLPIGRASHHRLGRRPFTEIYPEFAGQRSFVNLDAGLIELDDVDAWTSNFVDLPNVGPLADLNALNITMRLIDAPVAAIGAASGRLDGTIKALFYRYKSVGGWDYVSDFLIAPANVGKGPQTRPGDSGAVWHLAVSKDEEHEEKPPTYRPLAVQWGGQAIASGNESRSFTFALATSLTTVCHALDVELVTEHNTGALPYWGQMGHYSIAAFAVKALSKGKLKTFMNANIEALSFNTGSLDGDAIKNTLKTIKDSGGLVPLADVPDIVWKTFKTNPGGRDDRFAGKGRTSGPEHPTHYADIDQPGVDGKTLRELCLADRANVSVAAWQKFYDEAGHTEMRSRGLLPFRVWQFFDAMAQFAADGDAAEYLCAAGLLAHYVGDACQPLHGSMYSDGYADRPVTLTHHRRVTGEEYTEESHVGAGVHSAYESKMIDRKSEPLVKGLLTEIKKKGPAIGSIQSGQDAAYEIVALMDRAATRIPPMDLVEAFLDAGGKGNVKEQDALWDRFGDETIATMADGSRVLAAIWNAAWKKGGGISGGLGVVDPETLIRLYQDLAFVKSLDLDHIGSVLKK